MGFRRFRQRIHIPWRRFTIIYRLTIVYPSAGSSCPGAVRVRTEPEIFALLTAEQPKQLEEHRYEMGPRDHGGPPPR